MAKKNFKQLAVDNVEKVVFGGLALVALGALALGTQWSRYPGTAGEILDKISKGKATWSKHTWPQEDKEAYVISAENVPANLLHERLYKRFSPAQAEMSGRMVVNIFGGSEPVREPELLVLQNPISSSGRVFLEVLSDEPLPTTDPMMNPNPNGPNSPLAPLAADDNVPDEFRKGRNAMGAGDMAGMMPGEMASMGYGGAAMELQMPPQGGRGRSGNRRNNNDTAPSLAPGGDPSMMMGMEGMMGMPGMQNVNLNGQGYHFVSVRAVFPLRDQIMKYADAIHKSYQFAARDFDIIDFDLERQTAQPGPDPWTGSWERVDKQDAFDVLEKSAGYDAEVVNGMITNAVITMPLPMRITGEWRRQATHPQIEKFELTDAQIATEVEMQRKLLGEAVNQKKEMDSAVNKRRGFAGLVIDSRQLSSDMFGGDMYSSTMPGGMGAMGMGMGGGAMSGMEASAMGGPGGGARGTRTNVQQNPIEKLIADMTKGSSNKTEEEKRIREWIQSQVTAEGELLLFRYLDFNVEPGKTYRYRVRLILKNPNFGKRIADAGGVPHVVEGETRETPWSPVTAPVTVEDDVKYFLTEVREQSGRILPSVKFDVFEWNASFGTFINNMLEIRFGQRISDEVDTTVIEPAKGLYETRKYRFRSNDFLVDTVPEIRLDDALHEKATDGTSVKLPAGMRGKLPLAPQTLVSRADQTLVYLNPEYHKKAHAVFKSNIEHQTTQFESLKAPKVDPGMDALGALGLAGDEAAMMGVEGMGSRQRNVLRAGRKKNQQNPGMMMP